MESWLSGRKRIPAKDVGGKPPRGFESLTLRTVKYKPRFIGVFILRLCVREGFERRRSKMSGANSSEPGSRVLRLLETARRTKDLVTRDRIPHSPPNET